MSKDVEERVRERFELYLQGECSYISFCNRLCDITGKTVERIEKELDEYVPGCAIELAFGFMQRVDDDKDNT